MQSLAQVLPVEVVAAIETAAAAYAPVALGLDAPSDLLGLFARFVVGFMFFWAGATKLFRPDRRALMFETLRGAGIPLARFNAWFVSLNEMVFGLMFLVGALTLLSGAVLGAITAVAFLTVGRKHVEWGGPLFTLSALLYNNEIMILIFIVLVALYGPGAASVDAVIWPALHG